MATLVFLESAGSTIRSSSLPAVTAARAIAALRSGPVVGVLVGKDLSGAASDAARYVDKVLCYDSPQLEHALAETYAPVLAAAVASSGATALVATATSIGKDILPRSAALLKAGLASEIIAVTGANRFSRPTYAGNLISEVEVTTPVVLVTVRQTGFDAAAPNGASGTIESRDPGAINNLGAAFVSLHTSKSARPDLTEAAIVVSGGRGMKEGANFKILEELTDLLGGALGASRAACDAGMVPNDLQVGQTGKVVAPKLYIAVAISGAVQHLAGMKGSKTIVAINKDPEAPIFQVADYGLVTTWEKAIPEMIAAVKTLKK